MHFMREVCGERTLAERPQATVLAGAEFDVRCHYRILLFLQRVMVLHAAAGEAADGEAAAGLPCPAAIRACRRAGQLSSQVREVPSPAKLQPRTHSEN